MHLPVNPSYRYFLHITPVYTLCKGFVKPENDPDIIQRDVISATYL